MHFASETKVGFFVLISLAVLIYMAIGLGALNFNIQKYNHYYIYLNDLSGLEKKADIKIAGVKVGWIEKIQLDQDSIRAKIDVKIYDKYILYQDATAQVCQDSILGNRYISINPGNSNTQRLGNRMSFCNTVKTCVTMDELFQKFEVIASDIQVISNSLKNSLCSQESEKNLQTIIDNINKASEQIAKFSHVLINNESKIKDIIENINNTVNNILPATKDIDKLKNNLNETIDNINLIAKKINNGQGLLAKVINEENHVYEDVKTIALDVKNFTCSAKKIGLVFDSHIEAMTKNAENHNCPDFKTYFDFRIHKDDLFFLFELLQSQKGSIFKYDEFNKINNLDSSKCFCQPDKCKSKIDCIAFENNKLTIKRNAFKFGFQVGKIWRDFAFRFGIFESSLGVAIDYQFPFKNDCFRWVTSLEAFDLRGQDRICDRNPHLKWINKIFFGKNFYFDFGADDFVSKNNSRFFVGLGFRFGNDDLKYFLPS